MPFEIRGTAARELSFSDEVKVKRGRAAADDEDAADERLSGRTLFRRLMVVADHARQLPCAVRVVPKVDESGFADSVLRAVGVQEAVYTDLDGTITSERVHLDRAYELPLYLAADVLLYGGEERLFSDGKSRLIVVELEVVRDE